MSAHEQLILDILANTTNAQRGIGSLSRSIKAADDDVLGLAGRLDELGKKNARAKVELQGNAAANAQLDKLDAKMLAIGHRLMEPKISVEGAARAAFELAAVSAEIDKVSKSGAKAAASGGGLAAMATPMTGLIAAGVALSPVLITLGTGLAGLAAAAYGVAKPIENAAKKTGGLQANLKTLDPLERQVAVGILGLGKQYDAFQQALKPEVIGVFNQGLRLAGTLMHDVQPVAAATGKAFAGFLGQLDQMFRSGEWQGFFGFMARTAQPDMQLLGKTLIDTADALPPLVQALQPLAVVLLNVADDAAKATHGVEGFLTGLEAHEKSAAHGSGILNQAWNLVMRTSDNLRASVRLAGKDLHLTSDTTDKAATSAYRLAASGTAARGPIAGLSMAASSANDAFGRFRPALVSTAKNTDNTAASMRDLHIAFAQAGPPTDHLGAEMRDLHANVSRVGQTFPVVHHATDNLAASMRDLHAAVSHAGPPTDNLRADMRDLHAATGGETKALNETVKSGQTYTGVITHTTPRLLSMAQAVTQLTAALQKNDTGILTLQGDVISWRQSLQAATAQLHSNSAGLAGNSKNALANKAAVLQTTQQAQHLAEQELTTRDGVAKASGTLREQIHWLQVHGEHSKFAAAEIKILRQELNRIHDVSSRIRVTGSGRWNVVQSNLAGPQPGKSYKPGMAAGSGPGGAPPGWAWVGEKGPELAYFKGGETVLPAHVSMAVAAPPRHGYAGGVTGSFSGSIPGLTKWVGSEMGSTLHAIQAATAAAILAGIRQAAAAAAAGAPGAMGGPTSAGAAAAQAYARGRLGAYGWGASQMPPLIALWNQESGWNRLARNPSSGAYGIPQALPPGKMGAAANPPTSSAAAQINWGLGYIRGRYGSPAGAEAHERALSWYDDGGWLPPGPSLAVNNTGQPERVLKPGQPPSVALTQNGDVYIRDPVDIPKIGQRLSFAIVSSGFG